MRLTEANFREIIPIEQQLLFDALLDDLDEINEYTEDILYIDWQDYHNEYSPERTEPCPDYYGYYTLRFEHKPNARIGDVMTIDQLDSALCLLYSYNFLQGDETF